jgi:hypothetical protein
MTAAEMLARALSALLLLSTCAACRQVGELPDPAPPSAASTAKPAEERARPPAWLSSEPAVFEHVQKVYEDAGFPEVRTAVLQVSEDVPLPFYQKANRTLYIPPFTDGVEKMRTRLARVSVNHFSGALSFIDPFGSPAAAYEGFQALLTVAVAHEMAHHIQAMRRSEGTFQPDSLYDQESEAIEFEQAFLAHELEVKAAPAKWRDHYRLAIFAIRDAIPAYVMESIPSDAKGMRRTFAEAYIAYGRAASVAETGVNVEVSSATTVYAGYTERRIALFVKGGRSLAQLAAAEAASRKK